MDRLVIVNCVKKNIAEKAQSPLRDNFEGQLFSEIGIDSLSFIEIVVASMQELNVKIPRNEFVNMKTPNDLIAYLIKFSAK